MKYALLLLLFFTCPKAHSFFLETFDGENKATLADQGWEFFPTSGFSISSSSAFSGDYVKVNAGIGNSENMATPCFYVEGLHDTIDFVYRFFSGTNGTVRLGVQNGFDPVGTNVLWLDTVVILNTWTSISIPYQPTPWPYLFRLVFGFGTLDASCKIGFDNFTSRQGVGGLCDLLLPVELSSFTAIPQLADEGSATKLEWVTATEMDMSYYAVMKSEEGKTFDSIGLVIARGFSTTPVTYSFTDAKPCLGANYYYLKMVEMEGTFENSNVEIAHFTAEQSVIIHKQFLTYLFMESAVLTISSLSGEQMLTASAHYGSLLDLEKLGNGFFVLQVFGPEHKSWILFLNQQNETSMVLK